MSSLVTHYSEVAFVLLVTGAALTPWPALVLVVAGLYFAFLAWMHYRAEAASIEAPEPAPEEKPQ